MLTRLVRWYVDDQAAAVTRPVQWLLDTQQLYLLDRMLEQGRISGKRLNGHVAVLRPGQRDGIQRIAMGRKAHILAGEGSAFGVIEAAAPSCSRKGPL